MAFASDDQIPSNRNSSFGKTIRKDPFWMAPATFVRTTSEWRQYYKDACIGSGFPEIADHLFLSSSFKPHSPSQSATAYDSIIAQQTSDEDSHVVIFTLSYDHDEQEKISSGTWKKILAMLRQLVEPTVKVQLWVDRIDSCNRTGKWSIRQLIPFLLFPVVRISSRPDAEFWANIEGLAGVFGKGLYHDNSLDRLVIQDYTLVQDTDFFVSRADTWNPGDAAVTFYLQLMYGRLRKYRNNHNEALQALGKRVLVNNLRSEDSNNMLEELLGHERDSVFGNGRFEFQSGCWCKTDNPGWHGLREWITLDRSMHAFPDTGDGFQIKGFVNVYTGARKTMAIVHWELGSSGWTRKLLVELSHGSKEQGKALTHFRIPGYRQAEKAEELERERNNFISKGFSGTYSFDSSNVQWV